MIKKVSKIVLTSALLLGVSGTYASLDTHSHNFSNSTQNTVNRPKRNPIYLNLFTILKELKKIKLCISLIVELLKESLLKKVVINM